ncbi:MAG: Zn-dependent alcohol dehydrogenase [halophilic archaeon J07HX5]|nr:MAG: Zn-dependent alcohol dehydrogenase [halophilic archaeon J07HX5]
MRAKGKHAKHTLVLVPTHSVMRAAVLQDYGEPLAITDVEKPTPAPDGAVVSVEACGVCRSDWHGWQGDLEWIGAQPETGQIMGHEPAGTVVETGEEVTTIKEGDHVAIPFNLADGTCPECLRGHSNTCANTLPLGFAEQAQGAFSEEVHAPNADFNLARLPENVSSVDMAGLGCRFMTSFHALAHRADVSPGDWLAVHGCGGVGLSAVHIANALGANVVAVDLSDEKLEMAKSLGATATVNASQTENPGQAVQAETGNGADVSVDALGIADTCQNSILSLGTRGQHVQIGLTTQDDAGTVSLPTDMMVTREIEFIGSSGMPPNRYDEIFRMMRTGKLNPSGIVSETIDLSTVNNKLEAMTNFETQGIPVIDSFA